VLPPPRGDDSVAINHFSFSFDRAFFSPVPIPVSRFFLSRPVGAFFPFSKEPPPSSSNTIFICVVQIWPRSDYLPFPFFVSLVFFHSGFVFLSPFSVVFLPSLLPRTQNHTRKKTYCSFFLRGFLPSHPFFFFIVFPFNFLGRVLLTCLVTLGETVSFSPSILSQSTRLRSFLARFLQPAVFLGSFFFPVQALFPSCFLLFALRDPALLVRIPFDIHD